MTDIANAHECGEKRRKATCRNSFGPAMAACMIVATGWAAWAQDTRRVTEPVIPGTCVVLSAQLPAIDSGRTLAETDESKADTARIQRALDGCPAGQAVELKPAGAAHTFLTGPLALRSGVTLLVDEGVILFGSRNPRDYDAEPGACGVVDDRGRGCKPLISAANVKGAAVMGDGVIDGRGWARLSGSKQSWWDLAQEAKVKNRLQNCPRIIVATDAADFTLYRITLKNAPMYHVAFSGDGFTAWGVVIDTPQTARNTDGINPISARNVTITRCYIHAGDDQVAIKAGTAGPSSHITVAHNHFYTGHGISIGSDTDGGVHDVLVTDLSIDGADNGIRIKSNASRGGLVANVAYEDVCIRDTKIPIYMDTHYSFYEAARDKLPVFTGIVLRNVRVLSPGRITLDGYDAQHRLGITFDNVILDQPASRIAARYADVTLGPGPVAFRPSGPGVRVLGSPGQGTSNACQGKFVPMKQAAEK
jgi:polygalacturonase